MSHIGSKVLDQFIENTLEHHAAIDDMDLPRATELKADAFGRWMAFILLKNSDQSKYGSLLNGLTSQYSMDNNQYPKMIMAASDILAYHKHDAKSAKQNRSGQAKKDDEGGTGHANNETSFTQSGKKKFCYCCGKEGISAVIVQRRMTFRETNGLFVKLSYICRWSKVSRMKTVHVKPMMTRNRMEQSTNKPHE